MTDTTAAQEVVFHRPKAGGTEAEWEDCAGYRPAGPDGRARYVVVDGATEAYDSIRWVRQLVTGFLDPDDGPPDLGEPAIHAWFGHMQQRWVDEAPATFSSIFEERKFREDGSFATFLGCDVRGLGGPRPAWRAAALGDAVLFHVRDGRTVAQLPRLGADDFGINPDGVFTQPSMRDRMRGALRFADGDLRAGDVLYLATDALAEWLVRTSDAWNGLAGLVHPTPFRQLVAGERNAGRMRNDDVTLLRVAITPGEADVLMVCR